MQIYTIKISPNVIIAFVLIVRLAKFVHATNHCTGRHLKAHLHGRTSAEWAMQFSGLIESISANLKCSTIFKVDANWRVFLISNPGNSFLISNGKPSNYFCPPPVLLDKPVISLLLILLTASQLMYHMCH